MMILIITLHTGSFVFSSGLNMRFMFSKGFPMFPSIFMDEVHTNDGNEHKKEPHDAKAPGGLHNRSNQELNVIHFGNTQVVDIL